MKSLIIIDMQEAFNSSSCSRTILACQREIRKAIRRQDHVFYLEYEDCGPTLPELTKLTRGYCLKRRVTKDGDDGSYELDKTFKLLGIPKKTELVCCGVNVDCCVADTILGLQDSGYENLVAIADAMNLENFMHSLDPEGVPRGRSSWSFDSIQHRELVVEGIEALGIPIKYKHNLMKNVNVHSMV